MDVAELFSPAMPKKEIGATDFLKVGPHANGDLIKLGTMLITCLRIASF
jgi:hypothetical protein